MRAAIIGRLKRKCAGSETAIIAVRKEKIFTVKKARPRCGVLKKVNYPIRRIAHTVEKRAFFSQFLLDCVVRFRKSAAYGAKNGIAQKRQGAQANFAFKRNKIRKMEKSHAFGKCDSEI